MSTLLSLRNLTRRYGGNIAVNDVGFDVAEGEILGIMGANGAGKTTLFAMIAGNVVPSSGQILLDGQAVQGLPPERINAMGVSRTFQIVRPFPSMTVLENATVAAMYGRRQTKSPALAREQAMAVLEETGLADRAHLPASQLNLAGRKRLEIARALATEPKLLALDEPVAGMNPTERRQMGELFLKLRAGGVTLLLIEHDVKLVMGLCDRVAVLDYGALVIEDVPAVVQKDQRVIEAYLGA